MSRPSASGDFGESATYVKLFSAWLCVRFHVHITILHLTLLVCLYLSPSLFLSLLPGFAVTGHIDSQRNSRIFVSEVLPDGLAFNEGAYLLNEDTNDSESINNGITCGTCVTLNTSFLKRTHLHSQVCGQVMRSWC